MMGFSLWGLLGNTSSVITIVSEMRALLNSVSEKCAVQELKRLNPSIDFSALPDDLAYCADKIEIYIAKHKQEVLKDNLFPEEDKNDFVRSFFEEYPDLLPYKKYAGDWLRAYLNYAETLILQNADIMQKLLYREIKSVKKSVESISKAINAKNEGQAQQPYTANELYTKSFTKPLFLHKNDAQVTLENLFVLQKYIGLDTYFSHTHQPNLCERLARFVHEEGSCVMFIEGDAGSGKSSLISWMNYHVSRQDFISQRLMGDTVLITIRLRDLDKAEISTHESLIPAILNYMHIGTINDLEKIFPKALLVLDGFDELCMIENITDYEGLLYDLHRRRPVNYKIIITTRPKYIRTERIDFPHKSISLQHFDSELRAEWLDRYTSPQFCNQPLPPEVRLFIEKIDDDDTSIICDTPMTLYMLAARKIEISSDFNVWNLYQQIFYTELSETEYNDMFPNPNRDYAHRIFAHRDILYQISGEIAYRMYCTKNNQLYLSCDELSEIIENLISQDKSYGFLEGAKIHQIAERCYALCNYWKVNSEEGIVEFYHNNIRDFFLCEKIYREMNCFYSKQKHQKDENEMISAFCKLFCFSPLETNVCKFILLRAIYDFHQGNSEFPALEFSQKRLPNLFEKMLADGTVFSGIKSKNPIQSISNILTCVAQIYRHIYEPYLSEHELIKWWNTTSDVNKNGMLAQTFHSIFCQVPVTLDSESMLTMASRGEFSEVDFSSCDLRNIGFQRSHFANAKFENAILIGCDFSDTVLTGADFTNADMHYSKLLGAEMDYCILTGLDLRGTDLPDGSCGIDQEEQIKHLKSLNIRGCRY